MQATTSTQATTTLQATCLHLQRFSEDTDILIQVHSLDCLPGDIIGNIEQTTAPQQ